MSSPLAARLRPQNLDDFIGQEHLVGSDGAIFKLIALDKIPSMIFWGPPGSGKTTLAEIIANRTEANFARLSAVTDGKERLKDIIKEATSGLFASKRTILFIDEIHRWNKAQQDALLPFVEKGEIILIGATTENPSFTVVSPLLSRSRVFVFKAHNKENILRALKSGVKELGAKIEDDALIFLSEIANGDIRSALNSLEIAHEMSEGKKINKDLIKKAVQNFLRYDRDGEEHYNIISATHKSLRSSNASAAVYWIMRMLEAGEDPLYIARRLVRFASEDIGNANPNALLLANVVYDTCHKLGMPECDTALVQLAEYLANSPKNNKAYMASKKVKEDVKNFGNLPVPLHLRNAPTKLMKELDYGKGYEYDHDLPNKKSEQECFPEELKGREYF
ncbi:hypothetical protein A2483_05785 [Candidatus Peregrinibacteria bacterium RIFOXYC2_FULL_33_13]|nr:MAG: Recombination factor protein RarA [Candidatus Peregrinibacteria bacterium GW2011_GWA2_33_10]KKP38717.1 MAG: hypothetical protein UR30_C0016G0031 [Candidatus Peregrinibacteria bacterium GW2011_GWC2_33_13]OGJ48795.1 MAG: hypothetical protein A2229_03120 [Candidatus Peregrinibacteria bacterium RIFOXYA2_FULL_33_7]OGJ52346.1 MAG: hypothetical protein A2483_05785 [Candidatus Peregrinibacteria bacterium RIFOXYC2_FULL_33_13]